MPCSQCKRPAFYNVGEKNNVPLCLDCWHKVTQATYMEFLMNAAMMNQNLDDMDAVVGFRTGGRIPVAALAGVMHRGSTYNNIRITNSTVGVLNTGDLAKIDAVITLTKDTDVEQIGTAIKALTQAVIDAQDIGQKDKKELVDLIQSLAEQVVGSQGGSKPSVIITLLRGIEERAKTFVALSNTVQALIEAVNKIFGT